MEAMIDCEIKLITKVRYYLYKLFDVTDGAAPDTYYCQTLFGLNIEKFS